MDIAEVLALHLGRRLDGPIQPVEAFSLPSTVGSYYTTAG